MIKSFLAYVEKMNTKGLHFPFLYDPVEKKPSITLLFVYVTFAVAVASLVASHFYIKMLASTFVAVGFWALAMVFYRLHKLDSAKIDLKNDTVSLDGEDGKGGSGDS
jgi:hypothetical protein